MIIILNSDNFENEVIKSNTPVLVDFWATWCAPCRMLGPTIDSLLTDFEGKVKIAKLNVDEVKELAAKYSVMSIPTVLVFNKGEIVEQFVGIQSKGVYAEALNKYIK